MILRSMRSAVTWMLLGAVVGAYFLRRGDIDLARTGGTWFRRPASAALALSNERDNFYKKAGRTVVNSTIRALKRV